MNPLKRIIKNIFRKYNYEIVHNPPEKVNGIRFEQDLKHLIPKENPLIMDVGANRGQSIALFQKIFSKAEIHAFEPSTEIFNFLTQKRFGPSIHLYNFGLGEHITEKEFINYQKSGFSSFLEINRNVNNKFSYIPVKEKEIVDLKTIDWFVEENDIQQIDLLKIDTQGYDLQVLQGAKESIAKGKVKNAFIEIGFIELLYNQQSNAIEIMDFLQAHQLHLVDFYEKSRNKNHLEWCTALFSRLD